MRTARVAAHVHSTWSYDGEWTLAQIAYVFKRLRYHVVLMAEHDRTFDQERWTDYQRACTEHSSDEILLVPGIEYEDPDNIVHTVVWGEGLPFLGAKQPTLEILRSAAERDAATLFAHPGRRDAISHYRPEWRPLLSAVEIWNRRYDGVAPLPAARRLTEDEALAPFVSLDFHSGRQLFPLAISVDLDLPPSSRGVVDAIRRGAYRPELLGVSALRFTRGTGGASARALERTRRSLRDSVRRFAHATR
jgi:predicted metal-dependent phosphoesterase TrpH